MKFKALTCITLLLSYSNICLAKDDKYFNFNLFAMDNIDSLHISRIAINFQNEKITTKVSNAIGNPINIESFESYQAGENFFEIQPKNSIIDEFNKIENIELNQNPNSIDISFVENNSPKISQKITFQEQSLVGKINLEESMRQGLVINIDNFDKLPKVLDFPKGSTCYYVVNKIVSMPYYAFSKYSITPYKNLNDFIQESYTFIDGEQPKIFHIGKNNELPILSYDKGSKYMIEFNNQVYEAQKIQSSDNHNDFYKVCNGFNDIAGDYLEQQIKKYYQNQ